MSIQQQQTGIAHAISSMIENEEIMVDGCEQSNIIQADLCEEICQYMDNLQKTQANDVLSVRTVLLEVPSSSTRRIAHVFSSLLSCRVDNEDLLPATMDERANYDAMKDTTKAMTLNRTSLSAAELYSRMLVLPGVVGAGLVQMEALEALANVIRRWKMELCGRENQAKGKNNQQATKSKNNERIDVFKQHVGKSSNDEEESDDEIDQPRKRSKESRKLTRFQSLEPDFNSCNDGRLVVLEELNTGVKLSPSELFEKGIAVSKYLVQIPAQKEFTSWSSEAKETIFKSVCLIMGTLQAVSAGDSIRAGKSDVSKANVIVEEAASILERCIIDPYYTKTTNKSQSYGSDDQNDELSDNLNIAKKHETTKYLLRGLYPIITLNEVLPNGERGKMSSATLASKVIARFVQGVRNDFNNNPHLWPKILLHENSHSAVSVTTPLMTTPNRHPNSARTTSSAIRTNTSNTMTSPKPKASKTPRTDSSASNKLERTVSSRPILSIILGFLQKIATLTEGRERGANRTFAVDIILSCLRLLPFTERQHFLSFMIQLCQSKISVHRLIGSELVGSVFSEEWLWESHTGMYKKDSISALTPSSRRISYESVINTNSVDDEESTVDILFRALIQRLSDRYPTIRASSASALSNILRRLAKDICADKDANTHHSMSTLGIAHALGDQSLSLIELLRRRIANDENATVRRACMLALVELLVIGETVDEIPISITCTDISILSEVCKGTGVVTRRTAADGLSRLLQFTMMSDRSEILCVLEKEWSSSVLNMVLDSETSCTIKAVELFESVVLQPALNNGTDNQTKCAWRILSLTGGGGGSQGESRSASEGLRVALGKSIASSTSTAFLVKIFKMIHQVAVSTLDDSAEDLFVSDIEAQRTGVWCLFVAVMGHTKNQNEIKGAIRRSKIDLDFLTSAWGIMLGLFRSPHVLNDSKLLLQRSMQKCLQVLSKLADLVDPILARSTSKALHNVIAEFSLPTNITGSAIAALMATIVVYSVDQDQDEKMNCSDSIRQLYLSCENEIASHSGNLISATAVPRISKALFTMGELSMIGFSSDDDGKSEQDTSALSSSESSQHDGIRGLFVLPSKSLIDFVRALMVDTLPGFGNTTNPNPIRAHAFVAFGKLCLRNERLAQESLNIFARELHEKGNPSIQSNALLILGDLCVKYTNLVDRFLPVMAACMQSGIVDLSINALSHNPDRVASLVRKHAVLLLSNLLLQDFIKWRGLLFHRFLVACADEDEEVANLAEMVLVGPLLTKQPKLFSNQFVESIFVLNRCIAHPIYVSAASMGDGGSGISVGFDGINLSGELGRVRRMKMYHLMLSRMTDEEKIGVTARIAKDVLDGAVKGSGDLNIVCTSKNDSIAEFRSSSRYESAFNVLSDALSVLASPIIRVGKRNQENDDDIEDTSNEPANNLKKVNIAKGRLLSNISRKHMIDILLPILCNLKSLLQKSCSSLLKEVMVCLVVFYELYKEEVKECLVSDTSLLQEIDYDARRFKKLQQNGKTTATTTTTPATIRKQSGKTKTPGTSRTVTRR